MNKFVILLTISGFWLVFRSNQLFEGQINPGQEVKAYQKEERFFLPFPKNHTLVSNTFEEKDNIVVIKTTENAEKLKGFYEEILRSKNFENEYNFEDLAMYQFKFSKNNQEVLISITKEQDPSVIFKHTVY